MTDHKGSMRLRLRLGASAMALGLAVALTSPAAAQDAPADEEPEIVVQGFRASLNSALAMKRNETASVDSIVAEDIGKFPDSNLAESMQRIPGVALSRGDGGEGRNIAVRGLGSGFTRVRVNGMEGTAQTGSSDIYGAGNSGRSFDFSVFPTEIFSSLSVRKTPSADVEEGSLGATVDLKAPRPLDFREGFVLSATGRGVYNEISQQVDPRASLLVSDTFADGTFGVLASFAYQRRNIREVGYSAVDILSANTNGLAQPLIGAPAGSTISFPYCTPQGGFVYGGNTYNSPVLNHVQGGFNIGSSPANCSAGNPRTSNAAAFAEVFNRGLTVTTNPTTGVITVVGGTKAFLPRLPRYVNSEQDTERVGGTLTLQFQPDEDTDIAIDLLYSRYDVERRDNYIAGISFGRSITNLGQPTVSVRDIQFDANGSLVYGVFDGVDVRSEGLVDHFISDFQQANFSLHRRLNDSLEIDLFVGRNRSLWNGVKRFQTFIDAIDVDGFTVDYRDGLSTPLISFGFDVANPANFSYAPATGNGTTVLGGFSFQGKPSKNQTDNFTGEVNLGWDVTQGVKLRFGGQFRQSDYNAYVSLPYSADAVVKALPTGTALASITRTIDGLDELFGRGAPGSWVAIDPDKWDGVFDFDSIRFCRTECGAGASRIKEDITSAYAMTTFDFSDSIGFGFRGDLGVRYVNTKLRASGYISVSAPAGSTPTNLRGQFAQVIRSYDDWLPSANVVIEPTPNVFLRFSGAKVMSRPELGQLAPTSGITATTRTGNINNPFLDPIRADTFDAAVEWYFRPGSLISAAFFYKDIKTFIQRITSAIPFNQLGLPAELLNNTNTQPTEVFTIGQPINTPGGPLKGVELNLQAQLDFLPGFLSHFGVLANYTHVVSTIDYCLTSSGGNCTASTTADLINLSKNTASGTIFYEDSKFSIRATASYRDRYIRAIPASTGSDYQGNAPNTFVDASASYQLTDNIKLIVEAQNLTDARNTLYIDSTRQDTLFETRIGRTFTFGANVKF